MIRVMKILFLFAFCFVQSINANVVGGARSMKEAIELSSGMRDIAILHHGESWNATGRYLNKVWTSSDFKKAGRNIVQLEAPPTTPNELSEADRKRLEKESETTGKGMDRLLAEFLKRGKSQNYKSVKNYPAIALFDSEGKFVAQAEGLERMSPSSLAKVVRDLKEKRGKRDEYFKRAETATGDKKVHLLAMGIREIVDYVPSSSKAIKRSPYLDYIFKKFEEIKRLDPKDDIGYQRALTMEPFAYVYEKKGLYVDPETKRISTSTSTLNEALKAIEKELRNKKNRVLQPEQLQAIYLTKYNICQALKNDKEAADALLKGSKLDPDSVLGLGLSGKFLINYGEASLRQGWRDCHLSKKSWVFGENHVLEDIRWSIKEAGPNIMKFMPKNGELTVLSVTLKSSGKTISKSQKTVRATKKSPGEIRLNIPKDYKRHRNLTLEVNIGAGKGSGKIKLVPYDRLYDISDIYGE